MVIINDGTNDVEQKITFQEATVGSFVPYVTSQNKNAEQASTVAASGNVLIYKVPTKSVVTLVEQ
ncbi:MAG: hypothetical protein IPM85_02865 [Chitinophagaceae bacterium]|nr:hypothetical protein [Chitinophagaceae bacterium]